MSKCLFLLELIVKPGCAMVDVGVMRESALTLSAPQQEKSRKSCIRLSSCRPSGTLLVPACTDGCTQSQRSARLESSTEARRHPLAL